MASQRSYRLIFLSTLILFVSGFLSPILAQDDCIDGLAASRYACENVNLLKVLDRSEIATLIGDREVVRLNDVWGWTDDASGREFVLSGRQNGVSFIEITDPLNPIFLGDLPFHAGANSSVWRDVKTYQNFAYIVSDGSGNHGIQIFDLTQLLTISSPPILFEETAHYDEVASVHNIVINTAKGLAYAVGSNRGGTTCGGALHAMSLADPLNPVFTGCIQVVGTGRVGTGYTHDAQCFVYNGPDTEHRGKDLCILFSETAISIVDVGDVFIPEVLSIIEYPLTEYSHQGWISPDHRTLFADDELDELRLGLEKTRTLVFDVSDLDNPTFLRNIDGRTGSIDHNQYVRGGFLYQSNYTSGLTIWDVSDPANPSLEGYFDTFAVDDAVNFNGQWSNYPFFKSGTLVVSDRDAGLFLLSTPTIVHEVPDSGMEIQAVFPNPATEKITLRVLSEEDGEAQMRLVNVMGQSVLEQDISLRAGGLYTEQLQVGHLASGAYFLVVETAVGLEVRPVVVL